MRSNVAGRCQQRSRRPTAVSNQNARRDSSCLLQNEKNTSMIQQREFCDLIPTGNLCYCSYREQVERNIIKLSLSGTWSAILYDESMVESDNELSGLFRSETLLRVRLRLISLSQLLTGCELSAESQSYVAHLQDENGITLSRVPGHLLQVGRIQTPISTGSTR